MTPQVAFGGWGLRSCYMAHSYGRTDVQGGVVIQGDFQPRYHTRRDHLEDSATLLDWLSDLNFATILQSHCNTRTPGTGNWLLDLPSFQAWLTPKPSQPRVLFCRGDPGAGKTILRCVVLAWVNTWSWPCQFDSHPVFAGQIRSSRACCILLSWLCPAFETGSRQYSSKPTSSSLCHQYRAIPASAWIAIQALRAW